MLVQADASVGHKLHLFRIQLLLQKKKGLLRVLCADGKTAFTAFVQFPVRKLLYNASPVNQDKMGSRLIKLLQDMACLLYTSRCV